jgi:hypothetical protein
VLVLGRLGGATTAVPLQIRPVRADEWDTVAGMVLSTELDTELAEFGRWQWAAQLGTTAQGAPRGASRTVIIAEHGTPAARLSG